MMCKELKGVGGERERTDPFTMFLQRKKLKVLKCCFFEGGGGQSVFLLFVGGGSGSLTPPKSKGGVCRVVCLIQKLILWKCR